jgi:hypothetical protein
MSHWNNNWVANPASAGSSINLHGSSQSINTISLSNIAGAQGSSYSLNFDELMNSMSRPDIKKYEVYEISQDLLALSVCWARYRKVRNEPGLHPTITKLLDSELFRLVSEEDIAQANVIRDYYSKKIMVWKLKNISLTSFREDLNSFIHSDGKTFKETMMPLAFRLPEFYEYDVEFEKMSFEYNKEVKRHDSVHVTNRKHLTYIKSLSVNTKRLKKIEYWFSDSHNNLVQMNVETHNPLNSLLEKVVTNGSIELEGRYGTRNRDGNEFLKVEKYKFV